MTVSVASSATASVTAQKARNPAKCAALLVIRFTAALLRFALRWEALKASKGKRVFVVTEWQCVMFIFLPSE